MGEHENGRRTFLSNGLLHRNKILCLLTIFLVFNYPLAIFLQKRKLLIVNSCPLYWEFCLFWAQRLSSEPALLLLAIFTAVLQHKVNKCSFCREFGKAFCFLCVIYHFWEMSETNKSSVHFDFIL